MFTLDSLTDFSLSYLFSWTVGALASLPIILGPVEGHEGLALTLLVVHVVTLVDGDPVHLDRAPVLGGHQDLC